ncbi:MAG: sigma 54-interacting transcriptional regulator [Magnetococcales bacterium]|nr:sigma 54-interacting transcriptional regulator [Magnetococcales bacterium]
MLLTRHTASLHAYSVLLAGVGVYLDARLSALLDPLATLERVPSLDDAGVVSKRIPIGLIVIEVPAGAKADELTRQFIQTGHGVPLLAIDTMDRVTLMHSSILLPANMRTIYTWEELPELITNLLQLATCRLEVTLLRAAMETVWDNIQEGVIVVDHHMLVQSVNPAALNACHFVGPALGHSLLSQKGGCIPEIAALLKRVIASMKAELNVHLNCSGTGEEKTEILITATPLIDYLGHCFGAVAVILDRSRVPNMPDAMRKRRTFHRMIGVSEKMQEVYDLIESLANMDTTTLITGESGVGKELVAEALHFKGRRSQGPMVKVNCSALQDNLLESELFGHVKGAFTGAVRDRPGRFEVATGGTIFLDEIGDISLSMQTRLLRILQEKELERVGDSRTIKVDVRVVAATNKDLAEQIKLGKFREDLYFRLNVVEINLPPLRHRLDDIPLLINHFIQKFNHKYDKSIVGVQDVVLEMFAQYPWPGNIRELENAIEHAFVVCRLNMIRIKHLPRSLVAQRTCADPLILEAETEPAPAPVPVITPGKTEAVATTTTTPTEPPLSEKDAMMRALEDAHWKKKRAAKLLGVSRSTFYRKLEKFGVKS